nr:MAG TPA: nucelotide kinase [Caudoviricetes sp.]
MEMKEQIEMAKRIIERDGECNEADCKECPFGVTCDETDGDDKEFVEYLKVFVKENSKTADNVNSPNHYKLTGLDVEVIDVIRAFISPEEFKGYCKGNVIKYVTRENKKNEMEDLRKAKKYLEYVIGE